MDSVIDSTRQLCVSALKGLKKLINSELSGPQGASPEFAGVFATNTSRYMQIQVHTCKYMQIQIYTSKYNYIHANTSTYKQIQVYTCKYKYIQANTNDGANYFPMLYAILKGWAQVGKAFLEVTADEVDDLMQQTYPM